MKIQNPDCYGSHCVFETGATQKLPGVGWSGVYLCEACFNYEISYRARRNKTLGDSFMFELPKWGELKLKR